MNRFVLCVLMVVRHGNSAAISRKDVPVSSPTHKAPTQFKTFWNNLLPSNSLSPSELWFCASFLGHYRQFLHGTDKLVNLGRFVEEIFGPGCEALVLETRPRKSG